MKPEQRCGRGGGEDGSAPVDMFPQIPQTAVEGPGERAELKKTANGGFQLERMTPSLTTFDTVPLQATKRGICRYVQALFRTRTGDPLLTMEVLYQLS